MNKYIDGEKLSASITSAIELSEKIGSDTHSKQRMQYAIALQKVNKIIKEYPAADVQPVVHARYIERGFDNYECSNCGVHCHVDNVCTIYDNYCPNCGAKMDGDEHDNR